MVSYQVDGTVREKQCDKDERITHLTTLKPEKTVYKVSSVIKKIEKEEHEFWSYVYENGNIIEETEIKVKPIHDKQKDDYVRTNRDDVEENNLLELPIYYEKPNGKYGPCK